VYARARFRKGPIVPGGRPRPQQSARKSPRHAFFCVFISLWLIPPAQQYGYRVVKTYPHDRTAFTQGLEFRDGILYEGTGISGRSSVRKLDLATGRVIQKYDLPQPFFGEGITVLNQQILELTWQSQTGFIYDKSTLQVQRSFSYPGEGWGLTN